MTLSLMLPLGLAALASLLLPVLVHLARRSEQRVVVFAALRWLQAKPQPRRKHRLDETPLLLLRLLMLAALALLIAEPVLFGRPDRTPRVLVAPGVDVTSFLRDSGLTDARWQRLAPGFPTMDDAGAKVPELPAPDQASLSSLLREFDASLPAGTPLTVLVPPVITGADAERPVLSRTVDWRVVPDAVPPSTGQVATDTRAPIPTLMVRYAPEHPEGLKYLRAAGAAWQVARGGGSAGEDDAEAAVTVATDSTPLAGSRLAWLVPGPLPDAVRQWVAGGGDALLAAGAIAPELAGAPVIWRDATGPLARGTRLGSGRLMRLEHELSPAGMPMLLEPDFPEHLAALFAEAPPQPAWLDAKAHAPRVGATPYPDAPRPLAPPLAGLIALMFLVERWMANGPRRRTAA
ncbi:BatA domain-containing protein [Novilysobacter avium]|uniref:BatA domain-containing protein n=1 Tax=Novilysobacter avium TaxID=2781023 RepID=A0A7S6ZV80_9GAMM|nr:BatA domain-containing protein [Lysobacter avium]QOW22908.1 BatA domain-containing protein [Lysobacter avium]